MKFFKNLIIIVLVLALVIGVPVLIVYNNIQDSTDDTPIESYTNAPTKDEIMNTVFTEALDLSAKQDINFTFTEEELNQLLYLGFKENVNTEYNPTTDKSGTSDEENIFTESLDDSIPLIGGKSMSVRSAYTRIENDDISLIVPVNIGGMQSVIKMTITFEESTATAFILQIKDISIGDFSSSKGIGKRIFDAIKSTGAINEDTIKDSIEIENLDYDIDLDNLSITIEKTSLATYLNETFTGDTANETITMMIDMLLDPDNDMTTLGVINNEFGINFDLSKMNSDESLTTVDASAMVFDESSYMAIKAQSFVISSMAGGDSYISITDNDFDAMVYSKSNGYEQFKVNQTIPNTTAEINLTIEGVLFEFSETNLNIKVIMDINGLTTSVLLEGNVLDNGTEVVSIQLMDAISIGQDIDEDRQEYILANSDFLKAMLIDNISSMQMMNYNEETGCFEISGNSMQEYMTVSGTNQYILNVSKIQITSGSIDVYASVPVMSVVSLTLGQTHAALLNVLQDNDITMEMFDTTDPDQYRAISQLDLTLDYVADGITYDELSTYDTNALVECLEDLSAENQQIFCDALATESMTENSIDVENLYDSLFGR